MQIEYNFEPITKSGFCLLFINGFSLEYPFLNWTQFHLMKERRESDREAPARGGGEEERIALVYECVVWCSANQYVFIPH